MVSQFCGLCGFGSLRAIDRDSSPWPMGGRWGVEVDWSIGLGECRGLRVAWSRIGGSMVGGGEGCVSAGMAAAGAMASSASA